MKILWINHRDPEHPDAGGAEVHIREVARRLVQKGCEVTLLCERFSGSKKTELAEGVKVIRSGNKFTAHLMAPLLVSKLGRNNDAVIDDIAHAVPWWSPIVTSRPVIAIVHHVHQRVIPVEFGPTLGMVLRIAERSIRPTYKNIIAVSQSTRHELTTLIGVKGKYIRVVHPGVDHDIYRPSEEKFKNPTILWIGRMKKYKNPQDVIAAFALAKQELPDLKLIIVGSGDWKGKSIQMVKEMQLRDVSFLTVDNAEKIRLMQKSWAICVTSVAEGWGLVILEAAACGTPAIAYDAGATGEAVINGRTGFLVRYGNIEGLAEKVKLLSSDHKLLSSMSKAAFERSLEFDWDITTNATLQILQEAVAR
jgi:glycosyltransferase involved in cell wall biosynthesis